MKNFKNIFSKVVIILAACFMFASFSPSLDGRVVVVEQGEFPQGLFAKTVGYLPGDIISVANITGENTVDLLVIGALDPSEGVAIMITPEAALAIGIDKDSNNIVKITKRSGQDERVYGTAVIAKQNLSEYEQSEETEDEENGFEDEQSEINETEFDASEENALSEEKQDFEEESESESEDELSEEEEEPFEQTEEENDDYIIEEDYENEETDSQEEPFEELSEESEELEETDETEEHEEYIEEEFENEEELPLEEETVPEDSIVDEEMAEEETLEDFEESEEFIDDESEDVVDEEPEETEEPEEVMQEAVEEDWQEEIESDLIEEEIPSEPYDEDEIPVGEEIEETVEENTDEDIPSEECFEEEPEDDYTGEELSEEICVDELDPIESGKEESEDESEPALEETETEENFDEPEETDDVELINSEENILEPEDNEDEYEYETEEESYEAIVLVPADSMPPVPQESEESEVAQNVEIEETAVTSENEPEVEAKPELSYEKYMVESLRNLESGKYYIQIATLSIDENIMEIVKKYGNNYPITIVPMAGGIRKQIMVGPLSVDEYAVVLERFKSYGYKDAFLRKIK